MATSGASQQARQSPHSLFCLLAGQLKPSSAAVLPAARPGMRGAGAFTNRADGRTVTLGSAASAMSANSQAILVAGLMFFMVSGRHERVGNQKRTPGSAWQIRTHAQV